VQCLLERSKKIQRENIKAHFPLFIVWLALCIAFVFDTYTSFAVEGENIAALAFAPLGLA